MFAFLGTGELIFIFAVILLLFGAKKIPEFARGIGKGLREFKDASSNIRSELEESVNAETKPRPEIRKEAEQS